MMVWGLSAQWVSMYFSNRGANSRSVGVGFRSSIPTSPLASEVLKAASICSAVRLFVCFVLLRTSSPFHMNLKDQFLLFFCLYTAIHFPFLFPLTFGLPPSLPHSLSFFLLCFFALALPGFSSDLAEILHD